MANRVTTALRCLSRLILSLLPVICADSFTCVEAVAQDQPFFLFVGLTSPHTPISPSKRFKGRSSIGFYGDFVMETDHCIGRILAALDEHNLAHNTLVFASSDHGAAAYAGRRCRATPGQMKELEAEGHYGSGFFEDASFRFTKVDCVSPVQRAGRT